MTFNAMTERYEEITVCGKPALFTSIRIKRDTVPDGLYGKIITDCNKSSFDIWDGFRPIRQV